MSNLAYFFNSSKSKILLMNEASFYNFPCSILWIHAKFTHLTKIPLEYTNKLCINVINKINSGTTWYTIEKDHSSMTSRALKNEANLDFRWCTKMLRIFTNTKTTSNEQSLPKKQLTHLLFKNMRIQNFVYIFDCLSKLTENFMQIFPNECFSICLLINLLQLRSNFWWWKAGSIQSFDD
jgi:hypothetical protein